MSGLSMLCLMMFINIFIGSYMAFQVSSTSTHNIRVSASVTPVLVPTGRFSGEYSACSTCTHGMRTIKCETIVPGKCLLCCMYIELAIHDCTFTNNVTDTSNVHCTHRYVM